MTGDAGGVQFFRDVGSAFKILIRSHLLQLPRKANEFQLQMIEDFVIPLFVRSYLGRAERSQHEGLGTKCDLVKIPGDESFEHSL